MSRDEFEAWYISKFLRIMTDAEAVVAGLRNQFGGYDDHHMDGAWEMSNHYALGFQQVLKQAVIEATQKERERCAMVCEKVEEGGVMLSGGDALASDCYLAIRNT